jgi:hypothetical protein
MTPPYAGVPRPALRGAFGKALGDRIWKFSRSQGPAVPNLEISIGMIDRACDQASAALREASRYAKSMTLTIRYVDSQSAIQEMRLVEPTAEAAHLQIAARELFIRSRPCSAPVESLNLTVTAIPDETLRQSHAADLHGLGASYART